MMDIFRSWTFSWKEVAFLKATLISLGIILGLLFGPYLVPLLWLWIVVFLIGAVYFIIRFFRGV